MNKQIYIIGTNREIKNQLRTMLNQFGNITLSELNELYNKEVLIFQ